MNRRILFIAALLLAALGREAASSPGVKPPDPGSPAGGAASIAYAVSRERGFLVSLDGMKSWQPRNDGLPRKVVYPFQGDTLRPLTSLGTDPLDPNRVAVTTSEEIYLSEDRGLSWQRIRPSKPIKDTVYLTAVALSPFDRDTLLAGTSFSGFYESTDRGKTWRDLSSSARFLSRGAGFFEEISALAYDPSDPGAFFYACGFAHGIYRGAAQGRTHEKLSFPGEAEGETVLRFGFHREGAAGAWTVEAETESSLWRFDEAQRLWRRSARLLRPAPPPDPLRRERLRKASGKFGIYLASTSASGPALDAHLEFLNRHGLNSMVVDFKEDNGFVTYDTGLELPAKIGAVRPRIRLEELLSKAHSRGIYVIGRIVVFRDRILYQYNDGQYAVWDAQADAPWRYLKKTGDAENGEEKLVQLEYWVDPYHPFVWEYNKAIAEELQLRGVDEIQFDYIRFPSDGPIASIRYRYKREGMNRTDALESFLRLVRTVVHIPISTDFYGFNAWHRMGNWIGQSIDMLADYMDAICPMFYPSHFPREFIQDMDYLSRARRIYQEGTFRAASIAGNRSLVRPYVQAFLIGGELQFDTEQYTRYLLNQIEGLQSAPSSGFTLWNASNRYYMVTTSLKPLILKETGAARIE